MLLYRAPLRPGCPSHRLAGDVSPTAVAFQGASSISPSEGRALTTQMEDVMAGRRPPVVKMIVSAIEKYRHFLESSACLWALLFPSAAYQTAP